MRELTWTKHNKDKLEKVKAILEELTPYYPLTLRQIYYQMVGRGFIPNNVSQYGMLSQLLSQARYDGLVGWEVMEDRKRRLIDLTGWTDCEQFIEGTAGHWLAQYRRDLLQDQEVYLEVWTEKDALSSLFYRAASPFGVSVVVCSGFNSTTFLNSFRERVQPGKRTIVLYFGDHDPSGKYMVDEDLPGRFADRLNLDVTIKAVALNRNQTKGLVKNPDSFKEKDTRAAWYRDKYGVQAWELDAMRPDQLETITRQAIENEIDLDLYVEQVKQFKAERIRLDACKVQIMDLFSTNDDEV